MNHSVPAILRLNCTRVCSPCVTTHDRSSALQAALGVTLFDAYTEDGISRFCPVHYLCLAHVFSSRRSWLERLRRVATRAILLSVAATSVALLPAASSVLSGTATPFCCLRHTLSVNCFGIGLSRHPLSTNQAPRLLYSSPGGLVCCASPIVV